MEIERKGLQSEVTSSEHRKEKTEIERERDLI
jgi:hypothetical protein